jgi:hypothetical protein
MYQETTYHQSSVVLLSLSWQITKEYLRLQQIALVRNIYWYNIL